MTVQVHKLILVRHGESQWNHLNLFCGWVDVRLSQKGLNEAENAGRLLNEAHLYPDIVFTSKLSRSCQTANIVLDKIDRLYLDIKRSWRLNERHYGALQGKNKSQVLEQYGKEQYMTWRRSYDVRPPPIEEDSEFNSCHDERYKDEDPDVLPKSECLKDVVNRLIPFYESNIKQQLLEGKTVLVIAHGSTLRSLVKYFDQISDKDIAGLNIPTGIPLVYELDEDMKPIKPYYYLDPEAAAIGAAAVAAQGFKKQ